MFFHEGLAASHTWGVGGRGQLLSRPFPRADRQINKIVMVCPHDTLEL